MDMTSLITCYLSVVSMSTCLAVCLAFRGFLSSLPFLKRNLFTYLDSALCLVTPVAVTAEVTPRNTLCLVTPVAITAEVTPRNTLCLVMPRGRHRRGNTP